jgi:hypothetical protein
VLLTLTTTLPFALRAEVHFEPVPSGTVQPRLDFSEVTLAVAPATAINIATFVVLWCRCRAANEFIDRSRKSVRNMSIVNRYSSTRIRAVIKTSSYPRGKRRQNCHLSLVAQGD